MDLKSHNEEMKNEIDFMLTRNPCIVKDVTVTISKRPSDDQMLCCKVGLNLRRKRWKN